jgi:hypothetical protein
VSCPNSPSPDVEDLDAMISLSNQFSSGKGKIDETDLRFQPKGTAKSGGSGVKRDLSGEIHATPRKKMKVSNM